MKFVLVRPQSRFQAWRTARHLGLVIGLLCIAAMGAGAQVAAQLPEWLTAEEQHSIEKEHGEKDRVEILLKVSAMRLGTARTCLTAEHYDEANSEIKHYGSLIAYTSSFVGGLPKKESDKKKLYKIIELSLRRDLGMLDSLRYEMPQKYADDINGIYEQVRKVREIALGAVFGKDFFPAATPGDENEKKSSENPLKEN